MVDVKQSAAGVELSVTADHTLFVRLGSGSGSGSDSDSDSVSSGSSSSQYASSFTRMEAEQLLLTQPAGRTARLLSAAHKGVHSHSLTRRTASQSPHGAPFAAELRLTDRGRAARLLCAVWCVVGRRRCHTSWTPAPRCTQGSRHSAARRSLPTLESRAEQRRGTRVE